MCFGSVSFISRVSYWLHLTVIQWSISIRRRLKSPPHSELRASFRVTSYFSKYMSLMVSKSTWKWKRKYNFSFMISFFCDIKPITVSTSERPTIIRMSVSSSVPAPFMAAFRRRAKYSCGFLAHRTVWTKTNHCMICAAIKYQTHDVLLYSFRSLLSLQYDSDSKEWSSLRLLNSLDGYSYPEWCNSPLMFLQLHCLSHPGYLFQRAMEKHKRETRNSERMLKWLL